MSSLNEIANFSENLSYVIEILTFNINGLQT